MPNHTTAKGEDLALICASRGIPVDKVWARSENRTLRDAGRTPFLLVPGDVVFLPELEPREQDVPTDARHRFAAKRDPLRFRARVFDTPGVAQGTRATPSSYEEEPPQASEEQPLDTVPFQLRVDNLVVHSGNTDGDGGIDVELPQDAGPGTLVLNPGTDGETHHSLNWRHLHPVEELSGVCQRLTNLGFPCPQDETAVTPAIALALMLCKRRYGRPVDAVIDDDFRAFLVNRHGV